MKEKDLYQGLEKVTEEVYSDSEIVVTGGEMITGTIVTLDGFYDEAVLQTEEGEKVVVDLQSLSKLK